MKSGVWNSSIAARRLRRLPLMAMLRVAVLLLAILAFGLFARQTGLLDRQLIFFPAREITTTPASVGLDYDDVFFTASDGVRLHGWFVPGEGDLTLLWFHGNAGNISNRVENLLLLHERLGVNVFIFDYRGYGRSEGSPSEQGMYLDAEAALDYLRSRQDVDVENRLALFGRSVGAAVAVELATQHPAYAVILESPFTSVRAMARRIYPALAALVPVGAVVQSKFDTLSKIEQVRSPVMVLHGDSDDIVPIDMGREVFDAASEPKRFYIIQGANHNDTYIAGGNAYFDALKDFLENPTSNPSY